MKKAIIELLVFSGRPNPRWQISPHVATELFNKVLALPSTNAFKFADGLGYTGFQIEFFIDNQQALIFTVLGDKIRIDERNETSYKIDKEREIEKLLLDSAQQNTDTQLFEVISKQVLNNK